MSAVSLKPSQAKPSHLCFLGLLRCRWRWFDGWRIGNSASRFLQQDPVARRGVASTTRCQTPSAITLCRVRVVGERTRGADSGFSGGTRFCGTAGVPGWCRVEPEPRTTHRHQKKSRRFWAICHLPLRLPTPHGQSRTRWHRGVKIHAALAMRSCRQAARSKGHAGRQREKVGRNEADT